MRIAGTITNNGKLRTVIGGQPTTVEYNGLGDQTVVVPNPDTMSGKTGLAAAETVERFVMVLLLMFPVVTAPNPV